MSTKGANSHTMRRISYVFMVLQLRLPSDLRLPKLALTYRPIWFIKDVTYSYMYAYLLLVKQDRYIERFCMSAIIPITHLHVVEECINDESKLYIEYG